MISETVLEDASSTESREGVSMRVSKRGSRCSESLFASSMGTDKDLMWKVWPGGACMNFVTEASWSRDAVGEMMLVSRRRRRNEVLPVRLPATIRV